MALTLSMLDPAPVMADSAPGEALYASRALAQAGERLGYRAFWVQEHHNAASFAGTAPEVQMADLAAHTQRIRIGSGGVMLPNYSPLKVAEQAAMLGMLHPGRIELGIGRATGADPRTSAALLGPGAEAFPQMLRLALDWLLDASGRAALPETHRAHGIHANPAGGPLPPVWMLSSSPASAGLAGAMGLRLAFADFLAPGGAGAAIRAYRETFTPSPFLAAPHAAVALSVLAAETEAEAGRLAQTGAAWALARAQGRFEPFLSADRAGAHLSDLAARSEMLARALWGTGEDVAERLEAMAHEAGADELFLLTVAENTQARIASYEFIARACGVCG